jgi:hypothetical protein
LVVEQEEKDRSCPEISYRERLFSKSKSLNTILGD